MIRRNFAILAALAVNLYAASTGALLNALASVALVAAIVYAELRDRKRNKNETPRSKTPRSELS